jgi:choline dehydrogenase-like flavoprotein
VADLRSPNPLARAFVDAAVQAGFKANDDFSGADQEGVGLYQVTQKDGRRCSAATGYLGMAKGRTNLTVITGAHAARVLFDGTRAAGVEYRRGGRRLEIMARREIILSAGAVQSPQLLLLSGVGPRAELARFGIAQVAELPGVGQNLQDHLDVIVVDTCTRPVSYGFTWRNALRTLQQLWRYFAEGRGMYTSNAAEAGGFVRSAPDEPIPDLQFHFTPARLRDHGLDLRFLAGDGFSLHVCNLRPGSRGEIRLASADPLAKPAIHANYLSDPRDLEVMVRGLRIARKVLGAPALAEWRGEELLPGPAIGDDDDALRRFIRASAETIYHPVGTCRMGRDPMAVVDAELRVRGLQGLRVVDASIMPLLVGGNTNAPVIAIAEKAAEMIRASESSPAGAARPATS